VHPSLKRTFRHDVICGKFSCCAWHVSLCQVMLMSDFSFVNVRHMALNGGPSLCVLHCWLWHTKQCRWYLCQFLGGMSNKGGNNWAYDEAVFPSSTLLSVLNNYRIRHMFLQAQPSCFFSGAVLTCSRNTVIVGQFLACVWSLLHTLAVQLSVLVLALVTTPDFL